MEQSSQMCINYFANPNKWSRHGIYSLGDEVEEEGLGVAITAVHPDEPVRTGSSGPVGTGSPGRCRFGLVALLLPPCGLGVLLLLLWGVPHQLVVLGIRI